MGVREIIRGRAIFESLGYTENILITFYLFKNNVQRFALFWVSMKFVVIYDDLSLCSLDHLGNFDLGLALDTKNIFA